MKFRGTPKLRVVDHDTQKLIGVFDSKGYLEIEDEKYIERMKKKFKPVSPKKSTSGKNEKTAKTKGKEVK